MKLFLLGLIVQLVFLVSVFDIYLKTRVVEDGLKPEESCSVSASPLYGPAKRLVLIVSDGLRADVLFETKEELVLKKVITERGRWGISKARMPTRSIQCLLAMASGIYSDPLSFIDLWKNSAPQVDTIFDRASAVFYFGHPSVPYYFTSKFDNWHILPDYDVDWKKLKAGKSTAYLDEYVLDRFAGFMEAADNDSVLEEKLKRRGVLIMVHLSGVDKAAHQTGALSKAARDNVLAVDRGVARIEDELRRFYDDEETAFVFTSDHGTTNWGSHGGSTPEETDTPLIVWGPGVGYPTWDGDPKASPSAWKLGNLTRRDVSQVDLAPLMASLLGVPVPLNSIGILPYDYLDSEGLRAQSLACNAFQLASLASAAGRYANRGLISIFNLRADPRTSDAARNITCLIQRRCYSSAIEQCKVLMRTAVETFHYYHDFFTNIIYALIIGSFVAWTIVLLSHILPTCELSPPNKLCARCQTENDTVENGNTVENKTVGTDKLTRCRRRNWVTLAIHVFFGVICAASIMIMPFTSWPLGYYMYVILFVVLWWVASASLLDWLKFLSNINTSSTTTIFWSAVIFACVVEFVIWSFKIRYPISVGLIIVTFVTIFDANVRNTDLILIMLWYSTAATLEGLLFLPVMGLPPNTLILIFSLMAVIVVGAVHVHINIENRLDYSLGILGLLFVALSLCVLETADRQLLDNGSTSTTVRTLSWVITCSALPVPFLGTGLMANRLFLLSLYYSMPALLMSTRHEPFTLLFLFIHMFCWIVLEAKRSGVSGLGDRENLRLVTRHLCGDDSRRAAVFFFYLVFSYIVTDNYDDISSFDLQSVRCFTTELNELLIAFVLLLKFFLMWAILVGGFIFLSTVTGADPSRTFALVLLLANGLGYRFFFEFSEQGTQKEISVSISHHCFAQAFIFLLTLSYIVASTVMFKKPFINLLAIRGR